jgi:hypothetical protein
MNKKQLGAAKCRDFSQMVRGSTGSWDKIHSWECGEGNRLKILHFQAAGGTLLLWRGKKLRGWKVRETDVNICAAVSYRNNAKQVDYSKTVK